MDDIEVLLSQAFKNDKASHAYIVVGEKQHISTLLKNCATIAMCPNSTIDSCEVCHKVQNGLHQDVLCLPLDTTKNRLSVADMAFLVDESVKRPVDSSSTKRVFLIDATSSVSGIGSDIWQNKLLKTLEEPISGIYLFIGVTDAESLLPTVRSRCQILKQTSVSVADINSTLVSRGFDIRTAQIAAAMSGGSLQNALILAENSAVFHAYNSALDMAENMSSTKNSLKYVADAATNKDNINDFLAFLTMLYRESIVYRIQPSLCLLPCLESSIKKISSNYTIPAVLGCIEKVNSAKKRLDDGGNLQVVLDNLAISILEVKYTCRL